MVHRLVARPRAPAASGVDVQATDPAAEDQIYDVVGLYLNPPTNAVVVSVDETTQIQALNRTQPLLPLRPGLPARQTHDYWRNGLTSLYAALEIRSGRPLDLHVVLDNSSTHSTPAVQTWLAQHPEVQFHFTPKGASWLNIVEAWWSSHPTPFVWTNDPAMIVKKALRRGR
jgi:DDE superfamily endonuclease